MKLYNDPLNRLPLNKEYWSTSWTNNPTKNLSIADIQDKKCLQVSVLSGDNQIKGLIGKITERCEIGENKIVRLPLEKEATYSFDIIFAKDFKISNNRLVFAQWKHANSKKSPPVSLRYINGELLTVIKNDNEIIKIPYKVDLTKNWQNICVKIRLSKQDGNVTTLLNNKEIANFQGITAYSNEKNVTLFKMGLYRDAIDYEDTIYFSDFERNVLN